MVEGKCCCCVTSVVSDSVQPHRRQPTRLPRPWGSPGKNTGVGCHFLLQCMKVKSESEVAQLCLTPSDPMDCSPPGSSVHGIFQARVLDGVPLPCPTHACMLSRFSCVRLYVTPWTAAHQAPLSTGFSRQEYWSGSPRRKIIPPKSQETSAQNSGFCHWKKISNISDNVTESHFLLCKCIMKELNG